MWDYMHHWWDGIHGWHMGWFWVPLAVILILALLVAARPHAADHPDDLPEKKSPLDILEERYARGEIDREEFEAKKRDLEH
jgi:putative membrane protein